MGKRTFALLDELGLQYILGVRMRNIKKKDNLKVKEVTLNGNRYVVCLNDEEAKRV